MQISNCAFIYEIQKYRLLIKCFLFLISNVTKSRADFPHGFWWGVANRLRSGIKSRLKRQAVINYSEIMHTGMRGKRSFPFSIDGIMSAIIYPVRAKRQRRGVRKRTPLRKFCLAGQEHYGLLQTVRFFAEAQNDTGDEVSEYHGN